MRRLIFVCIIVLLSNFVLADDININLMRNDYGKSETLQFEIIINEVQLSGDLTTANIKLNKGSEVQSVSVNLVKINDKKYFVSFDLPSVSGNYTLVLEDIKYTKGNSLVKISFEKELKIEDRNGMSVNPGIIYMKLEKKDNPIINFKLTGSSNVKLSVEGDFLQLSETEFAVSGTKSIEVKTDVKKDSEGKLKVEYGNLSYSIPIYLFKEEVVEEEINESEIKSEGEAKLEFSKELNEVEIIEVPLEFGNDLQGPIYFKNVGSIELNKLEVTLSEGLVEVISFTLEKDSLDVDEVGEVNVIVNPTKDKVGHYEGELKITSEEGATASMPFKIDLKGQEIDPEPSVVEIKAPKKIIVEEVVKEESNLGLWIFLIVLLIIIGLVFVFYKKSKTQRKGFGEFISSFGK